MKMLLAAAALFLSQMALVGPLVRPAPHRLQGFSGEWILERVRPLGVMPVRLTVREALLSTDVTRDRMPTFADGISVARSNGGSDVWVEVLPIGDKQGVMSQTAKWASSRYVRWEDSTLVFYAMAARACAERREQWSLEGNERLRVVVTTEGSTPATVRARFRRRE